MITKYKVEYGYWFLDKSQTLDFENKFEIFSSIKEAKKFVEKISAKKNHGSKINIIEIYENDVPPPVKKEEVIIDIPVTQYKEIRNPNRFLHTHVLSGDTFYII